MKLEVSVASPELSAVIESNEAHVRLLSGTWKAMGVCLPLVLVGLAISILDFLLLRSGYLQNPQSPSPLLWILQGVILLIAMLWARIRIANLFHYQRVRELTHILFCRFLAGPCGSGGARRPSAPDDMCPTPGA
jgi:hypothetical protein